MTIDTKEELDVFYEAYKNITDNSQLGLYELATPIETEISTKVISENLPFISDEINIMIDDFTGTLDNPTIVDSGLIGNITLNSGDIINEKVNHISDWNSIYSNMSIQLLDNTYTQEILDDLLNTYLAIKNNIIYPNVFLITEPIGFGNRYHMQTINNQIYGHELDFQDIKFKVNFGIKYNAYEGFNLLMNFLADNKAIIEYDWGKGSRYADVRLKEAPKTEKDTFSLIVSKFSFALLNPFYIPHEELNDPASVTIENLIEIPITPKFEFTVTEGIETTITKTEVGTTNTEVIEFDGTGLILPYTVIINPEDKTVEFDDGTNAYDYINKAYNTFLKIENDGKEYIMTIASGTVTWKVTWKEWVLD